jgi:hypothetical protein
MAGEMRVLPITPGGEVSVHTGLSVNEVAAVGEASAPEDSVALAPAMAGLADEDVVTLLSTGVEEVSAIVPSVAPEIEVKVALTATQIVAAPLSTDDILALANQIAGRTLPLAPIADVTVVAPRLSLAGQAMVTPVVAKNVPGVSVSLRPMLRPTFTPVVAAAEVQSLVTTTAFALGTNLVQIGAFPKAENAATEWTRLQGRFGDVMGGKARVIQAATSGGKTFYRLRAQGFSELGDARRFCAALVAEGTDCIPVVVR